MFSLFYKAIVTTVKFPIFKLKRPNAFTVEIVHVYMDMSFWDFYLRNIYNPIKMAAVMISKADVIQMSSPLFEQKSDAPKLYFTALNFTFQMR